MNRKIIQTLTRNGMEKINSKRLTQSEGGINKRGEEKEGERERRCIEFQSVLSFRSHQLILDKIQ